MSDGTAVPFAKKPTVMPSMYRAVIFGEEHIVKGWHGENLLTDKGEFVFRRLKSKQVDSEWAGEIPGGVPSNHPIQSTTLLEVATLQSDGNGGWLLNGHNLWPLQFLPAGCRLNGITSSEVLRVYKGEIHAVTWVQSISAGSITLQLDTVLADWKTARKFDQANVKSVIPDSFYLNQFAGWSKPIWLTEFHQVGAAKETWLTGISKVLDPQPESVSVPDIMEKGINPFLHGLKNVPAQPSNANPEKLVQELTKAIEANAEQKGKIALDKANALASLNLQEALSKWMRFDPPGMKTDTKARIEKAVKMYLTDNQKRSLAKIAKDFGVSRKTVSTWFASFTKHTGFKVVRHQRHESVADHLKAESNQENETSGDDENGD